ncbi:ABC transporter ATP-binding protein [Streptomyces clavuligerus]|uniref:ABC transporter related protein n=1 Tax=Streptomyces clavuligerus TaxID=1901 RepID=B5GLL5_STRCL|nr:ABC transporter ATP-binding protein [Streptomyces clavuligerus]EDY47211.1 ABC transporter ATP-binding protein [Streptomyces clavuligerus]EFG04878.1 ABC transporter related protein [Streptomyces clavuligerus]MBY6306682.1 ABC transporter ATP-binding protein [Streptomyces clavuligerus]QCS10710.1 ABC transporter ATP-binding protein [Streptomyces clavuligerus]QPJ97254.1 ATP-binding cassette domain-containing protein [Streptomyces clavuligerus]
MTATPPPLISFRHTAKHFPGPDGGFTALGGVDLHIAEGEFTVLVGPSGCGKSTLLGIAAGLVEPTGGEVRIDGRPVHGPGPDRGVVFQQYALFPWLTVRGNVEFGLRTAKVPRAERRRRAQYFIDLVGLSDTADALPKTLSGGMKQRCAIARAYAADPRILLMDEPFGALDSLTRSQLQARLLEIWERERRTVLFVTHDVDEAVYLATRVVVMAARPGRVHRAIDIDLPSPRTPAVRLTERFTALRTEVWRAVHEQEPRTAPSMDRKH